MPSSYDEVPYESFPFPQTHPDRLAALAMLFGLEAPPLVSCRVLELGCASGGNLIPMAVAMPTATFVGIDLSPAQISQGRTLIEAARLSNIRLETADIMDVDERFGVFDYVIAHGVYSWVPRQVQERLLALCSAQLSPNGVAYISYNTLPGWHMRGMIRDVMRYHADQFDDPQTRVAQARAILDFLARCVPTEGSAYGMLLSSELEKVRRQRDSYLLHDHLEENNESLYFHEFVERAARHGLQYLAESDYWSMLASGFPREVQQTLSRIGKDVIRQEQLMDFLRNRTFRQTLLVRREARVNRTLTHDRVSQLYVSSSAKPVAPKPSLAPEVTEGFRSPTGVLIQTSSPVMKAAMVVLAECAPHALSVDELSLQSQALLRQSGNVGLSSTEGFRTELQTALLQSFASAAVEFHSMPSPFVTRAGDKPAASPIARIQARTMTRVTNLRHELVSISGELAYILTLLDGTRTRKSLVGALRDSAALLPAAKGKDRVSLIQDAPHRVDAAIMNLARSALLVA